ncbi:hypothetical protein OIU84_007748 [Salix udensis]|uniref:F-box domain-containing protein n=1 Tax=Salix udensis TaxID=889485 RepID=A0AAD6NZT8_9ROSI|nr:hypothetical protein OIU84_007748 [Salix udensis]
MIESTKVFWYDSDIPDSLLTEILIRLPMKSIFLFKSVSKRWLSLISDAFFGRYYVARINNDPALSRSHQPWIFLFPYFYKEVLPMETVIRFPTSFNPELFYELSSSLFSLSFLPVQTEDSPASFCHSMDAGIICKDDGSYTVVRIPNEESSSNMLELEIFSSETGTWTEFNFSCRVRNYSRSNHKRLYSTISYNGILHWAADKQIFAYDPYRSGESLRLWELTNYESGQWNLKHQRNLGEICSVHARLHELFGSDVTICFRPLAMHPFDWDTVYGSCGSRLISYNLQTGISNLIDYGLIPAALHPFILPPWPTMIPQPSWGPDDISN